LPGDKVAEVISDEEIQRDMLLKYTGGLSMIAIDDLEVRSHSVVELG